MKVEMTLEWDDTMGELFSGAAKKAVGDIADKVAKTARTLAPVGGTGNLRKGIVAKSARRGDVAAFVYANAPHSHLIELGHQIVRGGKLSKGGRVVGYVPARPFLRPALERHRRTGRLIFEKELRKVATKLGR